MVWSKGYFRCIAASVVLALLSSGVFAQGSREIDSAKYKTKRDLVDILIGWKYTDVLRPKENREDKKLRLSLLPSATTIPGAEGIAFVTAISASFFLGNPQTTNLSNIYFTPYTNFKGKFVFPMRTYIWSKDNKWNLIGDYRYLIYPEYTYGLGSNSEKKEETVVHYKQFRFHQSVLHKVFSYLVAGGGVFLDYHNDITEESQVLTQKYVSEYDEPPATSSVSNSLVLNIAFDSRQNSLNPQQGMFVDLVFRHTPTWMGSTYFWQSLYGDLRLYHSFNKKRQNLIAARVFYWEVVSGKSPYLDLPATLWDPYYRAGRGYYQARFRGDAMAYVEGEYRFDITQNGLWGGTVFANAQTLRNPATNEFGGIAPAIGGGLRLKFNKFSNINITLDAGFGRESWNWVVGMGEYF
jgi:outer membrane protein assembly factor BamA